MDPITEREINKIIDKYRFRTFDKIISVIRKDHRFDAIEDKDIRKIIKNRIHDIRPSRKYKQIYQVTIFSRFKNAYFTDLYDNLDGNNPRYWQIFINTNTRYAIALPLNDKSKQSINANLVKFVQKYHPRKLTSDEEPGLCAKINVDYLKDNKCGLFIVTDKQHSSLGIIDRFIRTLRDMNTPQEKPGNEQSTDKQFSYISESKMKKLLDSYNNTVHSTTKHTPKEMMDDPKLEDKFIEKCLTNNTLQLGIKDFKLKVNDLVRYIIQYDKFDKKRYTVSRETYRIESIKGNMYTIIAYDGTTKTLPRWRLIKVSDDENKRMGKTLGTNNGVIDKVIERVGNNKVRVRFVMPKHNNVSGHKHMSNRSVYEDVINISELRLPFPQFEASIETQT